MIEVLGYEKISNIEDTQIGDSVAVVDIFAVRHFGTVKKISGSLFQIDDPNQIINVWVSFDQYSFYKKKNDNNGKTKKGTTMFKEGDKVEIHNSDGTIDYGRVSNISSSPYPIEVSFGSTYKSFIYFDKTGKECASGKKTLFHQKQNKEGLRFDDGKVDLTQCPQSLAYAVAATFMKNSDKFGGKYPNYNWRKGMDHSKPLACLMRHISKYAEGEDIDSESGLPHLWHAACNIAMLIEYQYSCPQLDDRFKTDVLTKLLKDVNINKKEK